ncbi:MAG: PKD domain-containing protein [Bacteroidetes bacterium]|nr:PKD domain-containing protein [Bacteroidota bacterium]
MFTKIFALLAVISISSPFLSQSNRSWVELMDDSSATFTEIRNAFENEWSGKEITKGQGYKQFKRFEHFAAPRIYPSDKTSILSTTYFEYLNFINQKKSIKAKTANVWREVGPNTVPTNGGGAGRLTFIQFHPNDVNTIFVGTPNGGLWKSVNGGSNWTNSNDYINVIGCSDMAINPIDPTIMYLATGDNDHYSTYSVGVLKSIDAGLTWNPTGLSYATNSNVRIFKMMMDPSDPNVLIAVTTSGIQRTIDGGTVWTNVSSGNYRDLEVSPFDSDVWYATTTNGFKRSIDGGASWTTITSGTPAGALSRLAIATSANEPSSIWILAAKSNYSLEGVYKSTDAGLTFTKITNDGVNMLSGDLNGADQGGQSWYDLAFGINPLNSSEMWIGGINTWKTMNGGTSWNIQSHWYGAGGTPYVHADIHDIKFLPNSNDMVILCDGGMYKTVNSGTSFTDLSEGLSISQQYLISQASKNEDLLLAGHQDNGTNRFQGAGNWRRVIGGDGMACLIDWDNNNRMVASYQYGEHRRSTNGGNSFGNIFNGLADGAWVSPIHQDPVNPNRIYALGRSKLVISDNFGTSYTEQNTGSSSTIVEMSICKSQPNVMYILQGTGGGARIRKSIDQGMTFTDVTGNLSSAAEKVNVTVDPFNPDEVFVVYSGFSAANKVWKSTTGGTTWTNISTGLPNVPCNVLLVQEGTDQNLYLGNDFGVFYRDSITKTWEVYGDSLPNSEITDLDFYYPTNMLVAGTYGRGVWRVSAMNTSDFAPIASFNSSNSTICENAVINYTSTSANSPTQYQWTFQGGTPATSTSSNPTVQYANSGSFDVELTVTNSTGSDTYNSTAYANVQNCAGLEEINSVALSIYPNPAKSTVTIECNEIIESIILIDVNGKQMMVGIEGASNLYNPTVALPEVSNGVYTLQVKTSAGVARKMLIIRK